MKEFLKKTIVSVIRLWSMVYTISNRNKLVGYRNWIYTIWIRNFIGNVGKHVTIKYPCSLQGGGHRNILIGNRTTVESHSILGCWDHYGDQHFTPEIIIGDNCCIGANVTILKGVNIGRGCVVAAGAVLVKNAPLYNCWRCTSKSFKESIYLRTSFAA